MSNRSGNGSLESLVAVLERQSVDELHTTGDGFAPLQMRDIHSFNPAWNGRQLKHLLQAEQSPFGIDLKDLRLSMLT